MNALCIIPARGGSKRIPRKNIRLFHGRPIIAYAIAAALDSGCFAEVMVSTDDPEIAAIAREHGAVVPALRSAELSNDRAGFDEVVRSVLLAYREQGRDFVHACGLLATAALTTAERLREGARALQVDPELSAVLAAVPFSFPIQRALVAREGRMPMRQPEHYHTRSQDMERTYHDAGQWYWINVENFLRTGELMGPHCTGVVLDEMEAQDIDDENDWALAELKFQLRQRTIATYANAGAR